MSSNGLSQILLGDQEELYNDEDAVVQQSLSASTANTFVQNGRSLESLSHNVDDDPPDGYMESSMSRDSEDESNDLGKHGKVALHDHDNDEDQSVSSTRSTRTSETDDTIELEDPLRPLVQKQHQQQQYAGRRGHSASPQQPQSRQPPSLMKKRKRQLPVSPSSAESLDQSYSTGAAHPQHEQSNDNNNDGGEAVVVLGVDISHLSAPWQFLVCASGVFGFNLSFGYLQEFVSVEICNRNLGLFLALLQFTGYTGLSYVLRNYVNSQKQAKASSSSSSAETTSTITPIAKTLSTSPSSGKNNSNHTPQNSSIQQQKQKQQHPLYPPVPASMYIGVGVLSAIDMAMTNMAMLYINYPAKTLMKSSRVVFTMIFGVLMAGKRYRLRDYLVVLCMVAGLAIFMQADASSSAVFEPLGVVMLTISLLCDGAVNIMSETIMKTYGVGQDELIFRTFSLALIAVVVVASFNGDLQIGLMWLMQPGTYDEWNEGASKDEITWNVLGKVTMIVLFSSMGFLGSSCSAAITKNFGALAMSMTSTARRATTLFISFFMFDNECTFEHIAGAFIFITALTTKSFFSRSKGGAKTKTPPVLVPPPQVRTASAEDLEMQRMLEQDPLTY